jgi:hypothetical protein
VSPGERGRVEAGASEGASSAAAPAAGRATALRSRFTRLLWHPHQGLWNWRLVGRVRRLPLGGSLERLIIVTDSLLLAGRALARRYRLPPARRARPVGRPTVLYVDCGMHRDARQLVCMLDWFGPSTDLHVLGIEASSEHFDIVAEVLRAQAVELRQLALVGPDHAGASIRLYKSGGRGKGDSLFSERGRAWEEVPALRLSTLLAAAGPSPQTSVLLLRMNIEGAEVFVIEDLVDAGLDTAVDGYYGMWDDLSKIDRQADASFRSLIRSRGIRTFTFNDRDLDHPARRWAIRFDVETSIRCGWARKREGGTAESSRSWRRAGYGAGGAGRSMSWARSRRIAEPTR